MAARLLQIIHQRSDSPFGLPQPVWQNVLGFHAQRNVQQHDQVAAAPRDVLRIDAPLRLHQGKNEGGHRAGHAERLEPLPRTAMAWQHSGHEQRLHEGPEGLALTSEGINVKREQDRDEHQQEGVDGGVKIHNRETPIGGEKAEPWGGLVRPRPSRLAAPAIGKTVAGGEYTAPPCSPGLNQCAAT